MKIRFCACGWRINIWNFILDSSAFAIWYFCSVSVIVSVFHLLFGFCNLVSAAAIWYFCSVFAIILVFRLLFSFCNLVSASTIWYFRSVSAIVLVFLLFSFCNLVFELSFWKKKGVVFCFCKIWYFDFPSTSAIWYFCSISAIFLVFLLLFSFCNLVFTFSFCKKKIWSDILSSTSAKSGISTVLQLLQYGISVCLCNCFGISSSLQFLQFGISFCNLVFLSCLCNCFGILSSLQFLQFGIWVKFLQKKNWSDILSFVSVKSGISTFLQLLSRHLLPKRLFGYLVTCRYKSFLFSSYSYELWQPEFYWDCSQLGFYERTKHIKIDCHLTRHHLKYGTITLPFVHSSLQIADFFTKTHSMSRFCFLVGKLSMLVDVASWIWGEMLSNIYLVLFIKGRIVFSV